MGSHLICFSPHHSPLPLLQSKPSVHQYIQSSSQLLFTILPTQDLPEALLYTAARETLQKCKSDQARHYLVSNPSNSSSVHLIYCKPFPLPLSSLILWPSLMTGMPQLPWFPSHMRSSSLLRGLRTRHNGSSPLHGCCFWFFRYRLRHFLVKEAFLQGSSWTITYPTTCFASSRWLKFGVIYVLLFLIIYW